jgi:hypothetical protein
MADVEIYEVEGLEETAEVDALEGLSPLVRSSGRTRR